MLCYVPIICVFCGTEVAFYTLGSLWDHLTMAILDFIIKILYPNYNNDLLCTWYIFHLRLGKCSSFSIKELMTSPTEVTFAYGGKGRFRMLGWDVN